MGFPVYLPWSQERTELAMRHARTDLFMLDVQLGSACNARCPRCDSACCDLNEPAALDLHALCGLAEEMNRRHLNWLAKNHLGTPPGGVNTGFICGLGEPTVSHNMTKLKSLLRSTRSTNFSWAIFTNGIVWDDELENELKHGRLCVMVQYNSNEPELVAEMLGVGSERAAEHLRNRLHLQNLAKDLNEWHIERTGENFTGVAASIVPERDNLDELIDLVGECLQYGIFPLIGELEHAGHSSGDYYERHKLHDHELRAVYQQIEQRFNISYEMPVCPATIGAIHINNRNIVTVDEFTGLSCGWFGMGDPKVHEIGDIREMTYSEITSAILAYRESRIPAVRQAINDYPDMVFGGCGGNARNLLTAYINLY